MDTKIEAVIFDFNGTMFLMKHFRRSHGEF